MPAGIAPFHNGIPKYFFNFAIYHNIFMLIKIQYIALIGCIFVVLTNACKEQHKTAALPFPSPEWSKLQPAPMGWDSTLTKAVFYDKMLGALVGAAIGDAMGAPTEMWHRDAIRPQWGYVDTFTDVIRNADAEGTWEDNLPPGSTTDDTRWKYFMGQFLRAPETSTDSLNGRVFAQFIVDAYTRAQKQARNVTNYDPEPLEHELMQAAWLQEWAKVAKPYLANNVDAYSEAVDRFYGGELACGGMLYAPLVGAFFPSNPTKAYKEAFRLGFFDLGYARDITGLTAAMVSKAMQPGVPYERITHVCRTIDPKRYANSRLVGRRSMAFFMEAKSIAYEAKSIQKPDLKLPLVLLKTKRDPLYLTQVNKAYELLEKKLQDIPFHAGEIHLINLTALEFSEGDFQKAMEFVVNFGRDNDTVAAVTGTILGAWYGYQKLPAGLAKTALATNKKVLGFDLEQLAADLTGKYFRE
jgi:ADP-ribosylglycohydrolase